MKSKATTASRPEKVMETLTSAASLFQVPDMTALATDIGVPVNTSILMKNGQKNRPSKSRGLVRTSTIMCPW